MPRKLVPVEVQENLVAVKALDGDVLLVLVKDAVHDADDLVVGMRPEALEVPGAHYLSSARRLSIFFWSSATPSAYDWATRQNPFRISRPHLRHAL